MKFIEDNVFLPIGSIILAFGVMFLFFGGTLEGARFGLEILGVVYILTIAHSIIKQHMTEKRQKREVQSDVVEKML